MSLLLSYVWDGKGKIYFSYDVLVDGELKRYDLFNMKDGRWEHFLNMLIRLTKITDKYSDFKEFHEFLEAIYFDEDILLNKNFGEYIKIADYFPTEEKILRFAHAWTDAMYLDVDPKHPDAPEDQFYNTWEYDFKKQLLFLRDIILFKQDPKTEQGILYKNIHFYKNQKYICSTSSMVINQFTRLYGCPNKKYNLTEKLFSFFILRSLPTILFVNLKILFDNLENFIIKIFNIPEKYRPILQNKNVRLLIKSLNQIKYPSMNRIYYLDNYLKSKQDYLDFKKILEEKVYGTKDVLLNLELPKLSKKAITKLNEYDIEFDMVITGLKDIYNLLDKL